MLYFPEDIERIAGLPSQYLDVDFAKKWAKIYAQKQRLEPGLRGTLTLASASIVLGLVVTPAETSSEAVSLVVVRRRSQVEAQRAEVAALAAKLRAETEQLRVDLRQQSERDSAQATKEGVLKRILDMRTTPVRPTSVLGDGAPHARDAAQVTLSNFQAVWSGPNEMILKLELENTGAMAFEWAETRAYGKKSEENHAGAASVRLPAEPAEGLVGRLPGGERARAAILVERAKDITGPLTIVLGERGSGRLVQVVLDRWMPLQTRHTVQQMELRPVEPPDPERGKVSLHLHGIYGAIWLGDGAGLDESDATSVKGLGVRAQYAFNRWLAFEGELIGTMTGSAHFQDVTFEGMQGALTRSARLGRAQFGGVLRFSEGPYVPLVRLGVGLQGASHSGTLTTAIGEAPGPESFEWSTLATFGTGLDVRFGAFRTGIALAVVEPRDNEQLRRSIEAGIHLGYAWHP